MNFGRTMFWCVRLVRVANHRRLRFAWICETGTLSGSFAYIIVAFVVVHLMNLPLDDILAHLLKFTVEKFCHVLFIVMSKHNHWFLLDLYQFEPLKVLMLTYFSSFLRCMCIFICIRL